MSLSFQKEKKAGKKGDERRRREKSTKVWMRWNREPATKREGEREMREGEEVPTAAAVGKMTKASFNAFMKAATGR